MQCRGHRNEMEHRLRRAHAHRRRRRDHHCRMTASRSEFAQALQAARTARGLSVLQVAAELRLSDKQIQGLEQDDLANFYSAAYAERAATAYANFLNVATDLLGGPPYAAATEAPPLVPPVSSPATTAQRR
ncbi:MAG: hypothetical protein EBR15_10575, partial [Gammaproteobacteria bacterium]|nr:hypothetical protein [Gammaproteobacteria bacterium]